MALVVARLLNLVVLVFRRALSIQPTFRPYRLVNRNTYPKLNKAPVRTVKTLALAL